MKKAYIVAAKRTPIGKFLGGLSNKTAAELGSIVIKDILEETKVDPMTIDEVIVGNVLMAGQAQGVARQASVKAGIPFDVPATGINMICGSGMKSVMIAYTAIIAGEADAIIAGGAESMSGAGYVLPASQRTGSKMGHVNVVDHMIMDGLTDAFNGYHMGVTAENIAKKYSITREEQDTFSYGSQQKAIAAIDNGKFKDEIVPVEVVTRKETTIIDTDEFPNRKSTPEKLASLRPAFDKEGTVTAGNASGINDGASFVFVVSEEYAKANNLTPLAQIVAVGQGGVDAAIMGMGPVPAIANGLKKANMKLQDINVIELNEAFAAQSLGVIKELINQHGVTREWIDEHVNPNGGAIALGHPIGASGNRILVSLVHEMQKNQLEYGLASLCIGGGMGTAVILKLCK